MTGAGLNRLFCPDPIRWRSASHSRLRRNINLERRVAGPEDPDTIRCQANLSIVYEYEGKYAKPSIARPWRSDGVFWYPSIRRR
jgi:hypothetical protein